MNNIFKLLLLILLFFLLFFPQETQAIIASTNESSEGEKIRAEKQNQSKGWQGIIIQEIFPNPCGKDKDV